MPKDQLAAAETLLSAFTVFLRECSKSHPHGYVTKQDLVEMEHRLNMKLSELPNSVTAIKTEVLKVFTEINGKITELNDKLTAAQGQVNSDPDVDPATVQALADIKSTLDQLDAIVPDTPPPTGGSVTPPPAGNPTS